MAGFHRALDNLKKIEIVFYIEISCLLDMEKNSEYASVFNKV